ncbi:MAG: class I SAM-dependent RNA methyltransferase [Candidatus Kapaibacterium sp.]
MITDLFITTPKLLTSYLDEELGALGFRQRESLAAGVRIKGSFSDAMRCNLLLRCAHRVLYPLTSFRADSADDLYARTVEFPWEDVLDVDGYFSIISSVDNPTIRNTQYAHVKLKDAIADRMRKRFGRRPDSGPRTDGTVFFLYWKGSECAVYLDTSGTPLSRRGYRLMSHEAPLSEVLGAALVKATKWTADEVFVNPMCGSGTFGIEAALAGTRTPSQALRSGFGFMHTRMFDAKEWERIRTEAMAGVRKDVRLRIICSDKSASAIQTTRKNARTAGMLDHMDVRMGDFRQTEVPPGAGVVLLNPEYGERMGSAEHLESVYASIGDWFKKSCAAKRAYVFTGNLDLGKKVGLRPSRKIPFFNADIECRLYEYLMYEGSKKVRETPDDASAPDV